MCPDEESQFRLDLLGKIGRMPSMIDDHGSTRPFKLPAKVPNNKSEAKKWFLSSIYQLACTEYCLLFRNHLWGGGCGIVKSWLWPNKQWSDFKNQKSWKIILCTGENIPKHLHFLHFLPQLISSGYTPLALSIERPTNLPASLELQKRFGDGTIRGAIWTALPSSQYL